MELHGTETVPWPCITLVVAFLGLAVYSVLYDKKDSPTESKPERELKPEKEEPPRVRLSPRGFKHVSCLECQQRNEGASHYCRNCGFYLRGRLKWKVAEYKEYFCMKCRTIIPAGGVYCGQCGVLLDGSE